MKENICIEVKVASSGVLGGGSRMYALAIVGL